MLDPRVNGHLDYRTKELRKVLIRVSGRYYHALIEADFERTQAFFPNQSAPTHIAPAGSVPATRGAV